MTPLAWPVSDGMAALTDLGNGKPLPAMATRRGDWIDLVAPIPRSVGLDPWRALTLNGRMRGAARITLQDDEWRIRTELSVSDGAAKAAARADFQEAHHAAVGPPRRGVRKPTPSSPQWADWTAAVERTPWRIASRADGRLAVDLDLGAGLDHAVIEPNGSGLRCVVVVEKSPPAEPSCRIAVGRFLLTATDAARLVRAAATDQGLLLEVVVSARADDAGIDRALGALRLGVGMVGREADALNDASFARRYLEITLTKERQCEWMADREFSCSK
ncbi:MAG: hypothetical protein ACKVZ0_06785 [Gemmatimonadales bacterium]